MNSDIIRIEYKLDLIISALQDSGLMIKNLPSLEGIEKDICSVCTEPIRITVDPAEGILNRICGCKLPKQAYKITLLTSTEEKEQDNANSRINENSIPPE